MSDRNGETERERLIRQSDELLQELRVIIPGVQVIFAFLLTVAFTQRFSGLAPFQKGVYFAALLSTTLSTALLTAPTAQHRLLWRRQSRPHRLRVANALAILGTVFLALGINCVVFLIADLIYGIVPAIIATTAVGSVFVGLWYLLPLYQRFR